MNGDREAHAVLYRAHAPMVYTLAVRMLGSRALAEDVVQDCFVEVIRKAAQFRGEADIRAWIKQIAINKCLSQLRSPWWQRRAANGGHDVAYEWGAATDERPPELCLELLRALDRLTATARTVVWLHDVEGYTHEEIGRRMGRSKSFSKSQLMRAYATLREQLNPQDSQAEKEPCLGVLKTV
jgi:RNA polymerase sigma factor (sigma-70 family)